MEEKSKKPLTLAEHTPSEEDMVEWMLTDNIPHHERMLADLEAIEEPTSDDMEVLAERYGPLFEKEFTLLKRGVRGKNLASQVIVHFADIRVLLEHKNNARRDDIEEAKDALRRILRLSPKEKVPPRALAP